MQPPYLHWDEYQWEDEIRRHESLVACFFQDLIYCLDLPVGEPDNWSQEAEMPSDPVSARSSDALRQWISDHEEDEDGDSQDAEMRRPPCFSCVESLDQLAAKWNSFAIIHCSGTLAISSLAINCAFAKLLARTADFTEPVKAIPTALQITLGKRAVFDLEELVDRLHECRMQLPETADVDYFIDRLAILRDQLLQKLSDLRRGSLI